jgi:putative GTP pyrophosphokinase
MHSLKVSKDMATPILSKTQIDRLGDRLKRGSYAEDDLRALDSHRRTFGAPYGTVVEALRALDLEPTGRPAKSTESLVEKLRRESIRLVQVQDIAGCRVVVPDMEAQDQLVATLQSLFSTAAVVDRRAHPSYGYRAVHVIPEIDEKMIEIQVRTSCQHLWAEFSEKLSDQIDKDLKYGAGPQQFREMLADLSYLVAEYEDLMRTQLQQEKALADHLAEQKAHLAASKARVEDGLGRLRRLFEDLSAKLGKAKQ